jgi:hypothetical protein
MMKSRSLVTSFLVVIVATLGLMATQYGSAEAQKKEVGKVKYVRGDVTRAAKGSNQFAPLKKGFKLFEGDQIQTKKRSRFEASLLDGSVLRLGSKSKLKLEGVLNQPKKNKRDVKAKLIAGKVWASVRKMAGTDSKFAVSTSHAVAGVRGTRFQASVNKEGTTVKVYSGSVLVSNEPIYKVKGHTKATRVQVAGPQEISKKQWSEMIAGAMQMVKVGAGGAMTKPQAFAQADAEANEWEAWNAARDSNQGFHE